MLHLRSQLFKIFAKAVVLLIILYIFYAAYVSSGNKKFNSSEYPKHVHFLPSLSPKKEEKDYNVWLIFTKVTNRSPLKYKFHNLIENLLNVSKIPLTFNIIVDPASKVIAETEISAIALNINQTITYVMYDVEYCAKMIEDIVNSMTPHFSSKPGTYYSDALFYISLGLYRIAPVTQSRAVLLDCDLYFKKDIAVLFQEFDKFKPTALFGLAPELTPVYYHILHNYKRKHNTTFGEYYHPNSLLNANSTHPRGFPGYNSGVVLLNLNATRMSKEYLSAIHKDSVKKMTSKYRFKGHLGDQDFYTLLGFEKPHLIQTLNCGFNRQLCTWWRDHGYSDVFHHYFKCMHPTVILHGNCNSKIII